MSRVRLILRTSCRVDESRELTNVNSRGDLLQNITVVLVLDQAPSEVHGRRAYEFTSQQGVNSWFSSC